MQSSRTQFSSQHLSGWWSLLKTAGSSMAVTLTGVMVMTLVGMPQPAQAQSGILSGIQAVLSVIRGSDSTRH